MIGIVAIAAIIIFSFLAHRFESIETDKALIRELNKEIKARIKSGDSVVLSDDRIVPTHDINLEDKRITSEYLFLISRNKNPSFLDKLSFKDLRNEYEKEKAVKEAEDIEQLRKKREQENQERRIQEEKERIEFERLQKLEKLRAWNLVKSHCQVLNVSPRATWAGVYLIHSEMTNDFYIGSSINLYSRKYQHIYSLKKEKHFSYLMQEHFSRYGIENFVFYLLESLDDESDELKKEIEGREQHFISHLRPTYNYYMDVKEGKRHHLI